MYFLATSYLPDFMSPSSTISWISSTLAARVRDAHWFSTLLSMSLIWPAVNFFSSVTSLFAFSIAAMILLPSNATSLPLLLMIFIRTPFFYFTKKCFFAITIFFSRITIYCGRITMIILYIVKYKKDNYYFFLTNSNRLCSILRRSSSVSPVIGFPE